MKIKPILTFSLVTALLTVVALIVFALPLMLLWNWVMPEIFNLPQITFAQALGLNLLCSILFKTNVSVNKND